MEELMRALAIAAALLAAGCAASAPLPEHRGEVASADEQFRQTARQLGRATDRLLTAWGTVRLDASSPRTFRFATFEPAAAGPGLYLIEDGAGATWVVRFPHAATTHAFGERELGTGVTEPSWQFRDGIGVAHAEERPGGNARIAIVLSAHGPEVQGDASGIPLAITGPFAPGDALVAGGRAAVVAP